MVAFFFFAVGPPAYGQLTTFNIQADYDETGRAQISSQLILTSEHANFYVDRDYFQGLSAAGQNQFLSSVSAVAREFDAVTYPRLTALLGQEWSPGIDNDPRIFVLFVPMLGDVGGYFNAEDERPKSEAPNANEQELIYVNAKHVDDPRLSAFMAHEFQHLISYNQKNRRLNTAEATWLNELRSEFAPSYLGFGGADPTGYFGVRVRDFSDSPSDSLTDWHGTAADYGVIALFGQYLADRFGPALFEAIMTSPSVGPASVSAALDRRGVKASFDDVFADWALTNIVNDPTVVGGIYAYKNPLLTAWRVAPTVTVEAPLINGLTQVVAIKNVQTYSAAWLKVNFSAAAPAALLTVAPASGGEPVSVGYALKSWTGQTTFLHRFTGPEKAGLKILAPAGRETMSATLALAVLAAPADRTNIEVTLAPAPAAGITNVQLASDPILANQPFRVKIKGENIFAGAQLTAGGQTLVLEPAADPTEFSAYSAAGLAVGRYAVTVANLGQPAVSAGFLSVRGALAETEIYSALGDNTLFLVNGAYRRTLVDPRVTGLYNHLAGRAAVTVLPLERDSYILSHLIRAAGDTKVYSVAASGVKQWLNMSGAAFENSGRSWASVFTVNAAELKFYQSGPDITS